MAGQPGSFASFAPGPPPGASGRIIPKLRHAAFPSRPRSGKRRVSSPTLASPHGGCQPYGPQKPQAGERGILTPSHLPLIPVSRRRLWASMTGAQRAKGRDQSSAGLAVRASWTILPSIMVSSGLTFRMAGGGRVMMSPENTVRSARLPTVMVPSSSSRKEA